MKHHVSACHTLLAGSVLAFSLLTVMPFSAKAADPLASRTGFYFDTVITVSLYDTDDESILDKCFEKMAYYENTLSRTVEGSDVWNINHSKGQSVTVSDDTLTLLKEALHYCEITDGAFDVSIEPVSSLWNFHEDAEASVPDDTAIKDGLHHVDYTQIHVEDHSVTLDDPEGGIDLGAIAKGYISDGVRDVLRENGCESALISLGGNIYALGTKPDGSAFTIGVRRPFQESAYSIIEKVSAVDQAVITSGTYERYFYVGDTLYHHILDPATGYPKETDLTSVTILCSDGTQGDALSTTCFLLGPEKGMELIESLDGVEALFIDSEENLTASSGWTGEKIEG